MRNPGFAIWDRIIIATLSTLFVTTCLQAQTRITGEVTGLWKPASGPYIVFGELVVPANGVLVISPGTIVKFETGASLTVHGTLVAAGDDEKKIVFTSIRDQEFGPTLNVEGLGNPSPADWKAIRFLPASTPECVMDYCIVRYSQEAVDASFSRPQLLNLIFSDCRASQIKVNGKLKAIVNGVLTDYQAVQENPAISLPAPKSEKSDTLGSSLEDSLLSPVFHFSELTTDRFLDLHGYFDTEFEVSNKDAAGKTSDFDIHHLNFIFTFTFSKRAFVLGEVEYEHGPEFSDDRLVGVIALERAWLRLKLTKYLNIVTGKFLTPYGVYNVIHDASPSFVFTKLPFSLYGKHPNASGNLEMDFAKFLGGVQLTGNFALGQGNVEYYAYIANGEGAKPYEEDDNTNKAIGFRLHYADHLERYKIGASFYRDRNSNDANAMRQLMGADLEFNAGTFKLESEATLNRFARLKPKKAGSHRKALGFYAQESFIMLRRFQVFARYDRYDPDLDAASDAESDITIGLNANIAANIFFKLENHFISSQAENFAPYKLFIASIAVGF